MTGLDPAIPGDAAAKGPELASFRRRLFALFLDAFVLLLIGSALGLLFGDVFARMGPWGRIIGLLVATAYFAVLDGPLGDGRTLGKRALGIRVVGVDGAPPPWRSAGIRGVLLGIMFAVNGLYVASKWYDPRTVSLALFGLAEAVTLYLLVFERRRRQGLHDIAAGTFVARSGRDWAEPGSRNPLHAVGLAGGILVMSLVGWLVWRRMSPELLPLLRLRDAIAESSGHDEVGVRRMEFHMNGTTTTSLIISVLYYEDPGRDALQKIADTAAKIILTGGYGLDGVDRLVFNTTVGYNIGIASKMTTRINVDTPAGLRTNLAYRGKLDDASLDDSGKLIRAASMGDLGETTRLLRSAADPNKRDPQGNTALSRACTEGHVVVVKALIAAGADVNERDGQDASPLMLAAATGQLDVTRLLLAAHADVNAHEGLSRGTPLIFALNQGDAEVVKLLLDSGADPNDPDASGRTPLQHTKNVGSPYLSDLLIKAGARE